MNRAPGPGFHKDEDFHFTAGGQRIAATRITGPSGAEPTILVLHGYGTNTSRHSVRYLLEPIAARGHGSLIFDFSGNGESSGELTESSLGRRRRESITAAQWLDRDIAPVVIGTSMGAHLAAWAAPELKPRGLVLFCPAAYPAHASDLKFDGSLPRPGRYEDSPAYAGLREYRGDLLIIASRNDDVIPEAVIDGYLGSAVNARSKEVIWLDECGHFVHRWLPSGDSRRAEITKAMLQLLDSSLNAHGRDDTNASR